MTCHNCRIECRKAGDGTAIHDDSGRAADSDFERLAERDGAQLTGRTSGRHFPACPHTAIGRAGRPGEAGVCSH